MEYQTSDLLSVKARLDMQFGAVELQRVKLPAEIETELPSSDEYRLDYCLTPRTPGARLCFRDHWPDHRFEVLGKVCLVPAGETARARSGAGTQEAVICFLKRCWVDEWLDGKAACIDRNLDACVDIHNRTINRLMAQLADETRAPGFASMAMCEAISMQIAIELGRHYLHWEAADAPKLAAWRLALIDDRLLASAAPPTLAELAGLCGMSVRHLTRGFRATRGCSVGSFIRGHQIEIAKRELAEGRSVKTIAHQLGFGSRSSFSHAFQRASGVAPKQFRQQERIGRHRGPR